MVWGNRFDFLGFDPSVDLRTLTRWVMSMISAKHWRRVSSSRFIARMFAVCLPLVIAATAFGQESAAWWATQHPALFLVGDSIMKTGASSGKRRILGLGFYREIVGLFDPAKIHVYNEGRGGQDSRSYIAEGLWAKILEHLQPGDFVIVQFGHNDAANSQNYPDRVSVKASGDETQETASPKSGEKETIHTYGWYLRQYASDAKAKGAMLVICSPVPRNAWSDGKIKHSSTAMHSGPRRPPKLATPCSSILIRSPPIVQRARPNGHGQILRRQSAHHQIRSTAERRSGGRRAETIEELPACRRSWR